MKDAKDANVLWHLSIIDLTQASRNLIPSSNPDPSPNLNPSPNLDVALNLALTLTHSLIFLLDHHYIRHAFDPIVSLKPKPN